MCFNFLIIQVFYERCKEPYRQIDKINQELIQFEDVIKTLKQSSSLFDIQPPDEKNLKQCRRELKLAKVINYYLVGIDYDYFSRQVITENTRYKDR